MDPIPLDKFKDHVQKMHANDDYLFSEEYNVSVMCCSVLLMMVCMVVIIPCRILSRTMPPLPSLVTCPAIHQRTDMPILYHVRDCLLSMTCCID